MATTSPTLIVIAGPARGRTTPLSDSVSIGRDQQNALPIADPALSRHHCVIDRQSAGLVLRELPPAPPAEGGLLVAAPGIVDELLALVTD